MSYRLLEAAWLVTLVAVVAAAVYGLTGCAPVQCLKPVVTFEPPALPVVKAAELQCLSDSAYQRLAERDLLLHQSVEECRAILDEVREP